jgi:gas vesicle protein
MYERLPDLMNMTHGQKLAHTLRSQTKEIGDALDRIPREHWYQIFSASVQAFEAVGGFEITARLLGADPKAGEAFAHALSMINPDTVDYAKHMVKLGTNYAKALVVNPKETIKMIGEEIKDTLKEIFVDPVKKVAKGISNIMQKVSRGSTNAVKKVSEARRASATAMRSDLNQLAEGLSSIRRKAVPTIEDAAKAIEGVANAIESSARETLSSIRKGALAQIEISPLGANSLRAAPSM